MASQNLVSAAASFDAGPFACTIACDSVTGDWHLECYPAGGGNVRTWMFDLSLVSGTYPSTGNTPAQSVSDTSPRVFGWYYNGTGLSMGQAFNVAVTGSVTAYTRFRDNNGSGQSYQRVTFYALFDAVAGVTCGPAQNTSTAQVGPDPENSQEWLPAVPCGKQGTTSSTSGWKGVVYNCFWNTVGGRSNGQTFDNTVYRGINVAGMWMPWNTVVPSY